MCGETTIVYECPCGKSSREHILPRFCSSASGFEKSRITIELQRRYLQNEYGQCYLRYLADKPLPNIPGLPPSYQQATEQPPSYARAIAEEQPATYETIMMAIATFQPEDIVRDMHIFRASQVSLLSPLSTELETLDHRIRKAKRRLHRAGDLGFCNEVIIRIFRERNTLVHSLQQGQRYLDATLVLKHGLEKYQSLARESTKLHDYEQSRLHVKAASEHADKLLTMKIQVSRSGLQPGDLAGRARRQICLLEKVVRTLEARASLRGWAFVQVASRCGF
ncbi:hypothetical protein E4T49_04270 [Aureobasidium sp. EXF-10728]|nr:hypothetical protein E4T49_04270 [Aureobasidium sp. EXF-10728]